MDGREQDHFETVKSTLTRMVQRVRIVPMELPDGGKEWCFAPDNDIEKEMLGLLEIWDRWENRERAAFLAAMPDRRQEILELLKIVRTKIELNKTNRYFMGYLREGSGPESGRNFFLMTFARTVDHLAGIWVSLRSDAAPQLEKPIPEGGS